MIRTFRFTALLSVLAVSLVHAQTKPPAYTPAEQAVVDQLKTLRSVPDSQRGQKTTDLALQIRSLPSTPNKLRLAVGLTHLSTEGDFGRQTLQSVADTLASTLTANPLPPAKNGGPASPYLDLAKLVRYEHVTTSLNDPQYAQAMTQLTAEETEIEKADFTLNDLNGKPWTLSSLRGKVVLVNFWATWCPPCRKEMPDLDALAHKFKSKGLVILSISDEDAPKVSSYISAHNIRYPILLDPGRKVTESFHVDGIPKSFVFNREGKLVAQSIDMRTRGQFLQMLAAADLK
ncbi:TlpA disulfide reductase family protein [Edaphobacter albus]|uniref:TlpA disulfide reductase family protein n=1 Tax=Edaphobacter sp. 4G125 TaxID=2763071 RepID=UPI00164698FE|nr:TlpA disulfide reductase family protein [Edaphobacter sp. 4G125]QNI36898.1 TlpA family protein disulfide reductase [Edaphobacter sp. 4G125]